MESCPQLSTREHLVWWQSTLKVWCTGQSAQLCGILVAEEHHWDWYGGIWDSAGTATKATWKRNKNTDAWAVTIAFTYGQLVGKGNDVELGERKTCTKLLLEYQKILNE